MKRLAGEIVQVPRLLGFRSTEDHLVAVSMPGSTRLRRQGSAVYAIFVSMFAPGVTWKQLLDICLVSLTIAEVMVLVACICFGCYYWEIPQKLAASILQPFVAYGIPLYC